MSKRDDFGEIFDQSDAGRPVNDGDIAEVLGRAIAMIEDGRAKLPDVIEGILNMMRPGSTQNSHDILRQFQTAMHALDFGEVGEQVCALWLTMFPWGIGFHIGFDPDYPVAAMSKEAKRATIRSLCAVLQSGKINAKLNEDGRICITDADGDEHEVQLDQIVEQFRDEIDEKLGPATVGPDGEGPLERELSPEETKEISDWMKRWMT